MKRLSAILLSFLLAISTAIAQWVPDAELAADGFKMQHVVQPRDYSGAVWCTVVRKQAPEPSHRALLYVHGYNDYFFQREMADAFVAAGYNFYALDLRKYGRSILPGNKHYEVRDLSEYFADIDSVLSIMDRDGITEVTLMGHSTGGLITSYYMAFNHPPLVKELVLNSPFLDWNLGGKEWLLPAISRLGKAMPTRQIDQGVSTAYAESLLSDYHGEWQYNTEWKPMVSPPVEMAWLRAIHKAQRELRKKNVQIDVPILLMMSARSIYGAEWTPEHNTGDAVLDVKDIKKYGIRLGPDVTVHEVEGGLHDLFLSAPDVRKPLYNYVLQWMNTHM